MSDTRTPAVVASVTPLGKSSVSVTVRWDELSFGVALDAVAN